MGTPVRAAFPDVFAARIVLLHPESRGFVGLQSSDPSAHPRIMQNLLSTDRDRRTLREGQRYRLGSEVIIELTKPRGPCKALDIYGDGLRPAVYDAEVKARNPQSPRWGMSGFYASVVSGGLLLPGAPIMFLGQDV
jgi:MOSC domain-containing protein YiiM